jgi:hypothetical protein
MLTMVAEGLYLHVQKQAGASRNQSASLEQGYEAPRFLLGLLPKRPQYVTTRRFERALVGYFWRVIAS